MCGADIASFVTVTKRAADQRGAAVVVTQRCAWCRRELAQPATVGRPRTYCRRSCRQRAFEARRTAEELDWSASWVREAHRVIDDVAVISAALSDVVAERSVGPVDELDDEQLEDLLQRLRRIADDLEGRVGLTGSGGAEPELQRA